MTGKPRAPQHLEPATRRWWATVVDRWELEPHHVRLLTLAMTAAHVVGGHLPQPRLGERPRCGAVHAGWRGTAARAATPAVAALSQASGTRPADLVAAIGPSIGACCYGVGTELVEAFAAAGHGI